MLLLTHYRVISIKHIRPAIHDVSSNKLCLPHKYCFFHISHIRDGVPRYQGEPVPGLRSYTPLLACIGKTRCEVHMLRFVGVLSNRVG